MDVDTIEINVVMIMLFKVGTCTDRLLHDHKPLLETIRMQVS